MAFLKKMWPIFAVFVVVAVILILYYFGRIDAASKGGSSAILGTLSQSSLDVTKNEEVKLSFTLNQQAIVKIFVKNTSGTLVKNIYTDTIKLAAGTYDSTKIAALDWNGTNESGEVVSAGNYAVQFEAYLTLRKPVKDIRNITVTKSTPVNLSINVNPASFNPKTTQTAVSLKLTAAGNYQTSIQDSAKNIVKILADFRQVDAGDYSFTWDGKNASDTICADGDYSVVVEEKNADGNSSIVGNTKVTITSDTGGGGELPTGNDVGNLVEGVFSANYSWLNSADSKFGITFTAEKSAELNGVNVQWKSGGDYGYGYGTLVVGKNADGTPKYAHSVTEAINQHGVYGFGLYANGTGNFPSGDPIVQKNGVIPEEGLALAKGIDLGTINKDTTQCICDGSLQVNFDTPASLEKGKIYHLIIRNIIDDNELNKTGVSGTSVTAWSSPNTLTTRINTGVWTAGNYKVEAFWNGAWHPWTTKQNPYQPDLSSPKNEYDGSHAPLLFHWLDGTFSGDPYYSAASQNRHPQIYGTNKMGEKIVWNKDNVTIAKIGLTVFKESNTTIKPAPIGDLNYHIDLPNGTALTGVMAKGTDMTTRPEWKIVDVQPFTLENGKTYTIWFDSPNSTTDAWYSHDPVYGQSIPSFWLDYGWGGQASHAFINNMFYKDMDLSLSLVIK